MISNVFKTGSLDRDNLEARAVIVSMAQQLGAGQYGSQLCPACGGGASREKSLSLNVEANGVIKFYCHRAACGFAGSAYSTPGLSARATDTSRIVASHLNPLTADLHPLSERELGYFREQYGIGSALASANIRRTNARYAVSIRGPDAAIRGWITRRPWDRSPADTESNRNDPQWSTKSLTYLERDEPCMSWYGHTTDVSATGVYLVEDQLSAMRLVEYLKSDYAAVCALLGAGVNAAKIAEIQRVALGSRVSIALDRDATGAAFAMARKWGQAFAECRVIVLDKDLKDCSDEEIAKLPL